MYFLLTTPLIQFAPIGMDIYDFHVIGNFAGTEMPWMLALLVNLGLASPRASGFTSCGGGSTGVSDPEGAPSGVPPGWSCARWGRLTPLSVSSPTPRCPFSWR